MPLSLLFSARWKKSGGESNSSSTTVLVKSSFRHCFLKLWTFNYCTLALTRVAARVEQRRTILQSVKFKSNKSRTNSIPQPVGKAICSEREANSMNLKILREREECEGNEWTSFSCIILIFSINSRRIFKKFSPSSWEHREKERQIEGSPWKRVQTPMAP